MKPAPVGTRVLVTSGWRSGQHGVTVPVLPRLLNGHDTAVLIDDEDAPTLCFYWWELEAAS